MATDPKNQNAIVVISRAHNNETGLWEFETHMITEDRRDRGKQW